MSDFVLNAEPRQETGRTASRRLRREQRRVPGIVYGGDREPESVSFARNELAKVLQSEAFYSHVVEIRQEGVADAQQVVLRHLQRHPVHDSDILHIDFMRIDADKPVNVKVPLHFLNEEQCRGVKVNGGSISHVVTEVEVLCLPGEIPDFIEVDMVDVEVGQVVSFSDLDIPPGVSIAELRHGRDHDLPVVVVRPPRGGGGESSEDTDEGDADE